MSEIQDTKAGTESRPSIGRKQGAHADEGLDGAGTAHMRVIDDGEARTEARERSDGTRAAQRQEIQNRDTGSIPCRTMDANGRPKSAHAAQ